MTDNVLQPELAPAIRQMLDALRRRIRWYVWLEGLGWTVAWLGAAFWATLGVDRFLEPARPCGPSLGMVGLFAVWILFRKVLRRAMVPLGDPSMALLLERYFPQFGDSLLTAVELAEGKATADGVSQDLLARTFREAVGPLGEVRLPEVFNPRPLRTSLGAAAVLTTSIVIFGLLQAEAIGIWFQRSLLLSDQPWPHSTRLLVEGFDGGPVKILRGADYTVVALADRDWPEVPERVYVHFTEGGARKSRPMRRQLSAGLGQGPPNGSGYECFSYDFTGVMNPIAFDVVGGDHAVRGLRIEVVDSPTVTMDIDCQYPPYTGRPAKTFPVTGVMQFPWGSRLTVRAASSKDLVLATVEPQQDAGPRKPSDKPATVSLQPAADNPRAFQYEIPRLVKETTLLFTLHDTDGVRSREPVALTLSAVEDEKPRISARLQGVATAGAVIAPQAMLPVKGQVTDDYGIARVWFDHVVDENDPETREIAVLPGNATELALEPAKAVFDAANLGLKPGQKLGVCVKAADRFNIESGPNVGSSDRWVLDVVTPQQLQILLKARQLVLRQQFEETVKKVEYTRNLLAALDFSPPPKPEPAKKPEPGEKALSGEKPEAAKKAEAPGELAAGKPASNSGGPPLAPKPEPKPDAAAVEAQAAAERVAQRTLDVRSAAENSVTDAHEILGLADALDEIRQELVNNRIDDERGNEDKRRLQDDIVAPLRHVGGDLFPGLGRVLDRLQETIGNAEAGEKNRVEAVRQLDAILQEMRKILGKMTRLEDLNEVIEMLRTIIRDEEQVQALTRKRHKESLSDLKEKTP